MEDNCVAAQSLRQTRVEIALGLRDGLNCDPSKVSLEARSPLPQNVIFLGNEIIADVIG